MYVCVNMCVDFIEGGQFEIGSQYGCMERMHFCETGIAKKSGDSSERGMTTFIDTL